VDVGLVHPALDRRHRDIEVGRNLFERHRPLASHRDNVTLELRRELPGHGSILSARTILAKEMSTKPGAVPPPPAKFVASNASTCNACMNHLKRVRWSGVRRRQSAASSVVRLRGQRPCRSELPL